MSDDLFNSPFSGLNKNLRGRKKTPPAPACQPMPENARKAPQKTPPAGLSQDFTGEDEAASAMFLAAVGGKSHRRKTLPDAGMQTMAELLAAQSSDKGEAGGDAPQAPAPAKAARKRAVQSAPRAEELPEVELSDDETVSFAQAMRGVRPVDESRGRALAPPPPPQPVRHRSADRDYLAEFTEGKYEFALEYTEEFFEGHVMGLDPLVIAKLRAGQYSPETHIDLHGLNAEQAYAELIAFIKSAYINDRRHLIVVTGRGKNSPGGLSVLRRNMQEWLTKEPLRRVVLAFCTAQPKDGGAGALYVLLRKFKKNQGKVRWDISPPGV